MPEALPLPLIAAFSAMLFFGLAQANHGANFRGSSEAVRASLMLSSILSVGAALALLVYHGYRTVWYWPFVLLGIGIVASWVLTPILLGNVNPRSPRLAIFSLAGFIAWPVAAYLAFIWTP